MLTLFATLAVAVQTQLVVAAPRTPLPKPSPTAAVATAHSNESPAGALNARVLTLAIDIVSARWKPDGENDPEVPILAFAEAGKAPTVPGPLVRVRQGTTVRLTIHNRSDSGVVIGGLRTMSDSAADTVRVAAGASAELRYRLDNTGTFFYWGALAGTGLFDRNWLDSQLNGAIVVDAPNARTDDHVFVMSEWFYPYDDRSRQFESAMTINGKGFPYTQRLVLPQGDSVRFRVINTMSIPHPMHLHGFFYAVEQRGHERIPRNRRLLSNTDLVAAGGTETFVFAPTTPGNWVFHCHFAFHVNEEATLNGSPRDSSEMATMAHAAPHAETTHSMRGLVIAMQVTPKPNYAAPAMTNAQNITLVVQRQPGRLPGNIAAIGFMQQTGDSIPPADRVSLPGPVLELTRGRPTRITVRNNLDEPTSVHWHGLEIESFPDGVPNWSGLGARVYTQIAPRDSFVAEFVPPRSGTFPYHSHLNERTQMLSGMYGAIIVSDRPRDLARDHLIVTGGGGAVVEFAIESPYALVNGQRIPAPLRLTAGERHRLRFVTIHPDWAITYTLRNDSSVARWRAVAKDGADLPASLATLRPAYVVMGPGETSDFEFTPPHPGTWRIDVASLDPGWHIPLTVIVEPKRSR